DTNGGDGLAFACRLDFARTQQAHDEKAYRFKIPAKRFFRKLVGQKSAACRVPVVGTLFNPAHDLSERGSLNAKDGLTLLVTQQPQSSEDRRKPVEVFSREECVDSPLNIVGASRRFFEALKHIGKYLAQNVGNTLTDVNGTICGASIITAEIDGSGQACHFQQTFQFALMSAEPDLLFGD